MPKHVPFLGRARLTVCLGQSLTNFCELCIGSEKCGRNAVLTNKPVSVDCFHFISGVCVYSHPHHWMLLLCFVFFFLLKLIFCLIVLSLYLFDKLISFEKTIKFDHISAERTLGHYMTSMPAVQVLWVLGTITHIKCKISHLYHWH